MQYQKVLSNLQESINNKGQNEIFKKSMVQLKENFGQEISTKFLRGLCRLGDCRKDTKRISYLLKVSGFKTKQENRVFRSWEFNRYKLEIKTFSSVDCSKIKEDDLISSEEIKQFQRINNPYELTEEEQQQINEIKGVEEETGVCLFNHALSENQEKNRIREVIYNKSQGFARLDETRMEEVGNLVLKRDKGEVLFIIKV